MRLPAIIIAVGLLSAAAAHAEPARKRAGADKRPSVLLVLAHPDDETMIGGVLGRFRERGFRVVTAVVTNGENGKVVTRVPRNSDLVERDPGQAGTGDIKTSADLASRRQREHLSAGKKNGVDSTYFLSDPSDASYADDYDGGVSTWNRGRLTATLRRIAERVKPDLVITLNPDEGDHAHPQHRGIGDIVRQLHREGGFERDGASPSLYGIREHDWYKASQEPQEGDVHFSRTKRSRVLGKSYFTFLRSAASEYRTQSAQPRAMAARTRIGMVPGYQGTDLLRRLDTGGGRSIEVLLGGREPRKVVAPTRLPRALRADPKRADPRRAGVTRGAIKRAGANRTGAKRVRRSGR